MEYYKVYNKDEMENCLDSAFEVDNKVLVESHIDGREFSIGVISFNGEKQGVTNHRNNYLK